MAVDKYWGVPGDYVYSDELAERLTKAEHEELEAALETGLTAEEWQAEQPVEPVEAEPVIPAPDELIDGGPV